MPIKLLMDTTMIGHNFLCDNVTENECLDRLLLGTNPHPTVVPQLQCLKPGDYLFLYNYNSRQLRGPYVALTELTNNLEPEAWQDSSHANGFPWQVKINNEDAFSSSLSISDLRDIEVRIQDTWLGPIPVPKLNDNEVFKILEALKRRDSNKTSITVTKNRIDIFQAADKINASFIFKCNNTTRSKCFEDNLMGAPASSFARLISTIHPNSIIFLWNIEECRLHGVWRSTSRAKYDATAFPEPKNLSLYATLQCSREMRLEKGLPINIVCKIIESAKDSIPFSIGPLQTQRIIEELVKLNGGPELSTADFQTPLDEFQADDGHRVKSQGELIIDNFLFSRKIVHAYERRVQAGERFMRCDFYLPSIRSRKEVYIEYWGLLGQTEYDKRRHEKLRLYQSLQITPLELFPRDLRVLSEVWHGKICPYLATPNQ